MWSGAGRQRWWEGGGARMRMTPPPRGGGTRHPERPHTCRATDPHHARRQKVLNRCQTVCGNGERDFLIGDLQVRVYFVTETS